jgi:hypothetical protein
VRGHSFKAWWLATTTFLAPLASVTLFAVLAVVTSAVWVIERRWSG